MADLNDDIRYLMGDGSAFPEFNHALCAQPKDAARDYRQLAELGERAGIGLERTVALLLKYEHERQMREGLDERYRGQTLLSRWPIRELHDALKAVCGGRNVLTLNELMILVMEMLVLGLERVPSKSDALDYFVRQRRITRTQAEEASPETKRVFEYRRVTWLERHEELGNLLLTREDRLLRAQQVQQCFMETFATDFLNERQQLARMELLAMRFELLEENPNMSEAEINERLEEERRKREDALKQYQTNAAFSLMQPGEAHETVSRQEVEKSKHLLRRLAMLTHPDRLADLDLTDEQRRQLEDIWHDVNALRLERNSDGLLCRSIRRLEHQLALAEQILDQAGIHGLDAALTIRGETLEERIQWLERSLELLDSQIVSIQTELATVDNDPELRYMRALVDAPAPTQEEERRAMRANSEKFRLEANRLDAAIAALLAGRAED